MLCAFIVVVVFVLVGIFVVVVEIVVVTLVVIYWKNRQIGQWLGLERT